MRGDSAEWDRRRGTRRDRQTDSRTEIKTGQTGHRQSEPLVGLLAECLTLHSQPVTDRRRDRQTGRTGQTDRQTDRQTDGRTDRKAEVAGET